jgi:hypothetical protein
LYRAVDWIKGYGPPHVTWLVASLLVQRERQRWHHAVTRDGQGLDGEAGALAGMAGWRYQRHGMGVCLHAPDGEVLDVDFNDETGAVIDVWFFAERVKSVRDAPRWLAEQRLWRWRGLRDVIVDGCEELVGRGAAKYVTGYKTKIALAAELEARAAAVAEETGTPEGAARWLAALEPGGEVAHGEAHRAWLRAQVRSSSRAASFLELALVDASAQEAVAMCRPFVERLDQETGHAIELLRARPAIPVLDEVVALLKRASPVEDHPFAVYQACAYLLERGVERGLVVERFDVWSRLEAVKGYRGNPLQAEFAILALRHVPERGLALVRASLRSSVPLCVQEMAGALAAIDQRWCHRELAAAIEKPPRGIHAYLAAGLRGTTSDIAHRRAVTAFTPPTRGVEVIGYAFDDVLAANADGMMSDTVQRFAGVASELRGKYPEDWTGEWPVAPSIH